MERVDPATLPFLVPRFKENGDRAFRYTYRPPPQLDDGWPVGHIDSLSERSLTEVMERILDQSLTRIESVLIIKKGTLLVEEYFYDFDRTRKHQLRSVTKTVASILTGVALQQGLLSSVDESVASFYPERAAQQEWDDRKRRMTIKHLLTMTSGFEGNDWKDNFASTRAISASPDWITFAVSRSVVAEPGQRFAYNGSCLMVLSGILEKASEMHVPDFAAQHLFTPLGIEDVTWRTSPSGAAYLGYGLRLKPRDLAKMGQLFLNEGRWGDRQIVAESWVRESTQRLISFSKPRRGYGYLWWSRNISTGGSGSVKSYYAAGLGGQRLFIVPDRSLVVVINAGNYRTKSAKVKRQGIDMMHHFLDINEDH